MTTTEPTDQQQANTLRDLADGVQKALTEIGCTEVQEVQSDEYLIIMGALAQDGTPISMSMNVTGKI
jgi:hypothetical protein